jgi:RimJ/RimL family protein N-acetyltransferase
MTDPLLLDLPTEIHTERLLLRPPRAGDGAQLAPALAESLAALRRFLGSLSWVASEQTLDSAETFCRNSQAKFISRKDLPFLLFDKATGDVVGATGLHRTVWETPKAEVGYWGRTSRAGNGMITEAVTAIANYGFEHLQLARLELITDEENAESRRVAERCNFTLEGILRNERRAPGGDLRNTCIYARFSASP